MKKVLATATALMLVAGVASVASAADLKLNGELRVRAWHQDLDLPDTESFMDQRLRVGGNFAIAEGVSATFRVDVSESNWGAEGGNEFGAGRMPADGINWDRAHVDLTKNGVHVRAGQQYVGLGLGQTVNSQDTGVSVDVGAFSAFWLLDDDNKSTLVVAGDDVVTDHADSYLFGANYGIKGESYTSNIFVAGQTDTEDDDVVTAGESVYMIGADVVMNIDAIKLQAELGLFGGDASDTNDAVGTQLFVDASTAASETMTIGGQFYYAAGTDKADETTYTMLGNDFGGWDALNDLGTDLHNEANSTGRPFSVIDANAGVIGARLYLNAKTSEALDLGASVAYMTPEEDAATVTLVDSAVYYAVSMKYALMANTSLQAQMQYADIDTDEVGAADSELRVGAGLFVTF
ncbi:MAG: hypothetical protein H8E79_07295 [Desulfobulbaceae bacterium]|uniref:Porin domain-containing protein n=1 Tax=Candidatus Desulfatifera sulfidica TaxID=2841691 RepID=A0A8J6NC94_9BACT|nr:hypothetical protein [Candidatus Desulfatifera sulfidica]